VVHDVALQGLPCASAWTAPGSSAPMARRMRLLRHRLSRLPARLHADGGGDEIELAHMVATMAADRRRPIGRALPARRGLGVRALPARGTVLEIGRGRVLREGTKVAILSYGARLPECLKAADELATYGLSTTVADARFAKPLDTQLVERLAREHEVLITIEEGSMNGFGGLVMHHLATHGCSTAA
jgi:1-deoxy-D-xylulose-5-phosphate synthase